MNAFKSSLKYLQECTTSSGTGVRLDPHTGCTILNPNCVSGACTCGTSAATKCDGLKNSVCNGGSVAAQVCRCGGGGVECTDATIPWCNTMGNTNTGDDMCWCEKDSGTQTAGDGNTQGTCTGGASDKCQADGTCAP